MRGIRARWKAMQSRRQVARDVAAQMQAEAENPPDPWAPVTLEEALEQVPPELAADARRLLMPAAAMRPAADPVPVSATQSHAGGYPFTPDDLPWPVDEAGDPMLFLVQVNFAEVPPLEGFPSEGMLQWFVGNGDTGNYGLTIGGEDEGRTGFVARWWTAADLERPSLQSPTTPQPHDWSPGPLETLDAVAVEFVPTVTLISVNSDEGQEEMELVEELTDLLPDVFHTGSHVGGHPAFMQNDPRYREDRANTLILDLGYDELFDWGAVGVGHLFGDPAAVARGDLSSLWWDWQT